MINWGLWVFGRKITEVKCHFHHIMSYHVHTMNIMTLDTDFDHLANVAFIGYSSLAAPLTLSRLCLWKEVIRHSPHLRSGKLSLGWGIYIIYLRFFCIGHLSLLNLLVYVIIYLY